MLVSEIYPIQEVFISHFYGLISSVFFSWNIKIYSVFSAFISRQSSITNSNKTSVIDNL